MTQNKTVNLLLEVLGCFVSAAGIYSFAVAAEVPVTGVAGLSAILYRLFDVPMGLSNVLINIPIILFSYKLLGQEVADLHEKDRTRVRKGKIGFVFQSFNLIDELNVFENVELPLTYLGLRAAERKQRVNDILKRMAISHRAQHFPQQLSGGQQQRVAIARAVVTNPKLILADEPTGNLDSKNGAEVIKLLSELNGEGTTIIMVTHSQHDASFAHRTVHLFDGSIVASNRNL